MAHLLSVVPGDWIVCCSRRSFIGLPVVCESGAGGPSALPVSGPVVVDVVLLRRAAMVHDIEESSGCGLTCRVCVLHVLGDTCSPWLGAVRQGNSRLPETCGASTITAAADVVI